MCLCIKQQNIPKLSKVQIALKPFNFMHIIPPYNAMHRIATTHSTYGQMLSVCYLKCKHNITLTININYLHLCTSYIIKRIYMYVKRKSFLVAYLKIGMRLVNHKITINMLNNIGCIPSSRILTGVHTYFNTLHWIID